MLERLRQSRRLHTVVVTVFALLWLAAMLSGASVRAQPQLVHAAMAHSLCVAEDSAASTQANYAQWLSEHPSSPTTNAHTHSTEHGPHCLLCIALMPPPACGLQVAHYPQPDYRAPWLWPTLFPPARLVAAPLPPRGPPASVRV